MSDHGHDSHDHGAHDHSHGHDDHGHGGHDDHGHGGHDDHGHGGHDDHGHGHGHEKYGDYNSEPPAPSTLPPVNAPWLAAFGVALTALLAAIVSFSLRLADMPEHAEAEEGSHASHGAEHGEAHGEKHGEAKHPHGEKHGE